MSCPTCDHTMQCVSTTEYQRRFWCPRCGTLLSEDVGEGGLSGHDAPQLVGRCRKFIGVIGATVGGESLKAVHKEWHIVGIAESINKPEDRT